MFNYPDGGPYRHTSAGFAVIDLETTGLDPFGHDAIVEVAIVRTDVWGRELGTYETLVNPGRTDVGPTAVHGITADMLLAAPTFPEIASSVLAWLEGVVVVAHNAEFERDFLDQAFRSAGRRVSGLPAIDTLELAQASLELPDHRLATVCEWAGVEITNAHTAAGDARATAQMLPRLLARAGPGFGWSTPMPKFDSAVGGRYRPRHIPPVAHPA